MKHLFLLFALAAMPLQASSHPGETHAADRARIQRLIERFAAAFRHRDGAAMRGILLPGGTWVEVLDRTALAKVRADDPEAPAYASGRLDKLVEFLDTTQKRLAIAIEHARIETDGTIGTVYLNYRVRIEGAPESRGAETWQLVHTRDGWKISAMLYRG